MNWLKIVYYIIVDILYSAYTDFRGIILKSFDLFSHTRYVLFMLQILLVVTLMNKDVYNFKLILAIYVVVYISKIVEAGRWRKNIKGTN